MNISLNLAVADLTPDGLKSERTTAINTTMLTDLHHITISIIPQAEHGNTAGSAGETSQKSYSQKTMKNNDEDGWSSECPTTAGVYEFRRHKHAEITKLEFHAEKGLVFAKHLGTAISISGFQEMSGNPQWRPAKAVSQTPETHGCLTGKERDCDELLEMSCSLETRLADAERRAANYLDTLRAIAEKLGIREGEVDGKKLVSDEIKDRFDAWKALAGRLGTVAAWAIEGKTDQDYDNFADQETHWEAVEALAELRKLQGGEG